MEITLHKIDKDGFYLFGEDIFIVKGDQIANGYTDVSPSNPDGSGMYKPRLINGKAVETAILEEMRPVTPVQEPSEIEKLHAQLKASNEYLDFLEEVIVEMAQVVYQ